MKNMIFFNVDTQKDFINPDGALYIKDAERIKPQLRLLTQFAEKNKIRVINTADFHTNQSKEISDTPNFTETFPPHCLFNTEGCSFIDETYPKKFKDNYYIVDWSDKDIDIDKFNRARNIIIHKDAFDVFMGNKLTNKALKLLPFFDCVVVYGVAADVCVDFAVLGLLDRGYNVSIVADAIKGLTESGENEAKKRWFNKDVTFVSTSFVVD